MSRFRRTKPSRSKPILLGFVWPGLVLLGRFCLGPNRRPRLNRSTTAVASKGVTLKAEDTIDYSGTQMALGRDSRARVFCDIGSGLSPALTSPRYLGSSARLSGRTRNICRRFTLNRSRRTSPMRTRRRLFPLARRRAGLAWPRLATVSRPSPQPGDARRASDGFAVRS